MRTKIREAIYKAIADHSGYETIDARTGFAIYMNDGSTQLNLPCVWLCPLELTDKTGRNEGVKTYAGTMYFVEAIAGLTPEDKDAAWDRMEEAALRVLNAAAESRDIKLIENIRCLPDELALTGYMSISITVKFDVKVGYCGN